MPGRALLRGNSAQNNAGKSAFTGEVFNLLPAFYRAYWANVVAKWSVVRRVEMQPKEALPAVAFTIPQNLQYPKTYYTPKPTIPILEWSKGA